MVGDRVMVLTAAEDTLAWDLMGLGRQLDAVQDAIKARQQQCGRFSVKEALDRVFMDMCKLAGRSADLEKFPGLRNGSAMKGLMIQWAKLCEAQVELLPGEGRDQNGQPTSPAMFASCTTAGRFGPTWFELMEASTQAGAMIAECISKKERETKGLEGAGGEETRAAQAFAYTRACRIANAFDKAEPLPFQVKAMANSARGQARSAALSATLSDQGRQAKRGREGQFKSGTRRA